MKDLEKSAQKLVRLKTKLSRLLVKEENQALRLMKTESEIDNTRQKIQKIKDYFPF